MTGKGKAGAQARKAVRLGQDIVITIRENVPATALVLIAFGASFGHIAELTEKYGPHGWVHYATAACVDLLCIIGAEERQRDKRIGRQRAWGYASWPTLVLILGIGVTLTANVATADPSFWSYAVSGWPAAALLIAVSIFERRTSYRPVPASAPEMVPASAPETVPASAPEEVPASAPEEVPASAPEEVPASAPEAVSAGEDLAEVRQLALPANADVRKIAKGILRKEPDIKGAELGRRLGYTPRYGRMLKNELEAEATG